MTAEKGERLKADYSTKHREGGAVGGLQHCPVATNPKRDVCPPTKLLRRTTPTSWSTRRKHDKDTPRCLQCPAVPAAERQQNPARDGKLFQYRRKSIHTKNNLLHTVYLNQQSDIHRDVLHANAPRHCAIKTIFIYTHTYKCHAVFKC